jgi:hypothetical protein
MLDWLWKNKEWVFSGVGVAALVGFLGWLRSKRKSGSRLHQSQQSGHNSTNIQAGRDVNIGGGQHGR